jgi:hypothetical protein
MKITIESTTQIVEVNGIPARIWDGETESGIKVCCLITRIAAHQDADLIQFDAELKEQCPPFREFDAFPLRMIL